MIQRSTDGISVSFVNRFDSFEKCVGVMEKTVLLPYNKYLRLTKERLLHPLKLQRQIKKRMMIMAMMIKTLQTIINQRKRITWRLIKT